MLDCAYQVIYCWEQFNEIIAEMPRSEGEQWLYRGQSDDWPLTTAIERALKGWRIPPQDASSSNSKLSESFGGGRANPNTVRLRRIRFIVFPLCSTMALLRGF